MHIESHTCISWMMSCLNLGVHIILYSYYGLAAKGIDIWWRRLKRIDKYTAAGEQFCRGREETEQRVHASA